MEKTLKRIRNPEMLIKLGRLLRAERERRGLTQAQASRRVRGLRQATISKIERGGDATLDTLVSYATALGIELAWVPVGRSSESVNAALSYSGAARSTLLEELADLKDDES
jgi:transcriptional regulator with XRE-family HTH domain